MVSLQDATQSILLSLRDWFLSDSVSFFLLPKSFPADTLCKSERIAMPDLTTVNPPPRKRFQIHLSTAIVLTFTAGALIWANVSKMEGLLRFYGWPFHHIHYFKIPKRTGEDLINTAFFLGCVCIDLMIG